MLIAVKVVLLYLSIHLWAVLIRKMREEGNILPMSYAIPCAVLTALLWFLGVLG